mmetsp:Transcript_23588/g.51532  ORF Transcript_23588/g.51532 Transcript_23588/m.51532 type:complete len:255 (+) Transcript_23588:109-873(+)
MTMAVTPLAILASLIPAATAMLSHTATGSLSSHGCTMLSSMQAVEHWHSLHALHSGVQLMLPVLGLHAGCGRRQKSLALCSMTAAASESSTPQTVDLRRQGRSSTSKRAPNVRSYGRDPRKAVTETPSPMAPPDCEGAVRPLLNIDQLAYALQAAHDDSEKPVVIKFFSPRCISCKAVKPKYERLAKNMQDVAHFYEVNHVEARTFCQQSDVKFMPAVHVYAKGELARAMPMGVQSFPDFNEFLMVCARVRTPT